MNAGNPQWRWAKLGDVLTAQSNRKPLQQGWSPRCHPHPAEDGEWGVLKTTAIQAGWFDPTQNKALPASLEPKPGIEVQSGDLLITCAGPRSRCGVPTLVRHTRPKLMMSGKMYRFRPTHELDSQFLEYWLLSLTAQTAIDAMKTGISDSGLNLTHARFLELPVPVPPMREQRLIADTLDDHLSRLDAGVAYLDAARRRIDVWLTASLDTLIWTDVERCRIGDLLSEPMRNGYSGRAVRGDEPGVRTLTLTAVTKHQFTDEYTKIATADPSRVANLWLKPGDLLVQRSNTPELVGSSALYKGQEGWSIFPDLMIRLRIDPTRANVEYVAEALRSEGGHRQLRARAKGLAGSMPKIDQGAVADTGIPLPTLAEQNTIAVQAQEIRSRASKIMASIEFNRSRMLALRKSLLLAAFSGEMIDRSSTQDRIEEMADA